MRKFDYSFIKNGSLPTKLFSYILEINSLRTIANFKKQEHENLYEELEKIARVQSVKTSNAIEGIVSTDERINEIVNQSCAPKNHNEEEIAGYRDALNFIHNNYESMQINEETILKVYSILMKFSSKDINKNKYKQNNNVIIELDKNGNRSVRFNPVSAVDTPFAMEQLVLAYQDAIDESLINNLLLIPCFVLDFLCIHPFADGNGRMSRLLTILLLHKAGFHITRYISFEEQTNLSKNYYYESLKLSSIGWLENNNDYTPFIEDFIFTLYRCYSELDVRFDVVHSHKTSKKERVRQTIYNSIVPISKKEICSILLDVSPTTVEQVLSQLKKDGSIKLVGSGRATKYIKK